MCAPTPSTATASQGQRERALGVVRRGMSRRSIATDVAARGIHVDDVACVVHFDPPTDSKDYTHRSGRTARAGAAGTVVSFVSRDQSARGRPHPALVSLRGMEVAGREQPWRRSPPTRCAPVPTTRSHPRSKGVLRKGALDDARSEGRRPAAERSERPAPGTCRAARSSGSTPARASASSSAVTVTTCSCTSRRSRAATTRLLNEGAEVEFEVGPGRKGEEARSVRVLVPR